MFLLPEFAVPFLCVAVGDKFALARLPGLDIVCLSIRH